jgi:hypothetical protein
VAVPQADLVVVILGMIPNGHPELACIWNQLMPGIKADEPLQPEKKLQARLNQLCATASLPLPQGKRQTKKGEQIAGMIMQLDANQHGYRTLTITYDGSLIITYNDGTEDLISSGYGQWRYTKMRGFPPYSINAVNRMRDLRQDFVAASAYAWTSPTTLEVRVHYVNWISRTSFVFDFEKNEVTMRDNFPSSKPETIHFVGIRG